MNYIVFRELRCLAENTDNERNFRDTDDSNSFNGGLARWVE